jgi:O-antigen/teichoic acid export membrane protein
MPETVIVAAETHHPKSTKRIVRNVLSNWGSYLFDMVLTFFLAPFVIRHLGDASYGVWTLLISLTGYLGLLDMGVRGAVTRYVARFHATAEHEKAGQIASSALFMFTIAGTLAILTSLALAFTSFQAFHLPPHYQMAARVVLILTGLSVAVSLVNGIFGGILIGLQRFDLSNSLEVMISGSRALIIVLVLHSGMGIMALAGVHLAFNLSRGVATAWLSRRLYPELRIRFSNADRAHAKMIFSFSIYAFLLQVSGNLIYYTDNVVIGANLPLGMITFYVIGGNLVEYARVLVSGISQAMSPLASSLEARQEKNELQTILLFSTKVASMVALPIAVTFMLRGGSFIGLWMGPQYAELSGRVLFLLTPTLMLWAANNSAAGIVLGIGKHKAIVPALLAEGVGNLVLSLLWVRKMGILGVAIGTMIPNLASSLFFWPWYVHRILGVRPLSYAMNSWIRPGIAILPFAAITFVFEKLWPAPNVWVFFLQVGAALPVALVAFWFVCLTAVQRQLYSQKLTELMARPFPPK